MESMIKVKGVCSGIIHKADGSSISWTKPNMIVNMGFDFIIKSMMFDVNRPLPLGYIAIGTGGETTTATMTKLSQELVRVPTTYTWTEGEKSWRVTAVFPAGIAEGNITEAGVFSGSDPSDSMMFDRSVFSAKGMDPTDGMTINFDFTVV